MKLLSAFRQHRLNDKYFKITIKVQVFGVQLDKICSRKNNRILSTYYFNHENLIPANGKKKCNNCYQIT